MMMPLSAPGMTSAIISALVDGGVPFHPISVTLVSAALVAASAAVLTLIRKPLRVPDVSRRLRAHYEERSVPALISSPSGRITWLNGAAEETGLIDKAPLAGQLQRLVEIDDPAIYRLARRALDLGFALASVRSADTRERCYLATLSPDGQTLLWSVQPAGVEALRSLMLLEAGFETAQFGHVGVTPDGQLAANARFRQLFGSDIKAVLDRLPYDRVPEGGRIVLKFADGREGPVRVFMLADRDDSGSRDYLFFPTGGESGADSAASAALEAVPVALLRLDLEGRVLWANSASSGLLGPEPLVGQRLSQVIDPIGRPVPAMINAALRDMTRGRGDIVRLVRNETEMYLQVSLTRTRLDENDSLLAVITDASEMRNLQDQFAQSQKMEAVGQLAGGVAHDFNNVLTAISGHTDLLLLGKDISHPDYSDLMQVRQNANRAAALVRQLLAFSRKQTLAPEELSLRDVISDTLHLLDRLIGEKVTLRLDHARDLGAVRADQQQLEQALVNLVVNARDAMQNGGVITISTRNRSYLRETKIDQVLVPVGDYIEITVEDDGPGLPEDDLDRIFEPFYTTKPVGEGTGLGLSTVYGIVKQSGGIVAAGNRPDGGARFRIYLPRVTPATPVEIADEDDAPAAAGPDMTGRGVVLLVEDEAPVRSFASRALEIRGYEVEAAESAEAAMEYLEVEDNPVDLIVSDVVMPGMDGPTFAAAARKLRPGLPVIFVSGYAEESFHKTLADDDFLFLSKPFSLVELTAKVKEALS